jgi:hypothetical protein
MADPRRPGTGIRAGALFLMLAIAGCSDMTPQALGTLIYTTVDNKVIQITNPSVDGCHRLGPVGAKSIANNTLNDVILHTGPDCQDLKDANSYYLATQTSNPSVPSQVPWRSFTVVGGNA